VTERSDDDLAAGSRADNCVTEGRPYYADHGDGELRIYSGIASEPTIVDVVTLRVPGDRDPDALLRAYGWLRVGPWAPRGDGRDGRQVAMIEPTAPDPALAQLERDQLIGEERRAAQGWSPEHDDCWAGTRPQF
jgi:hypothetical protein